MKKLNKGQALVEFVMLLPIIMMILFVVVDFASVYYSKNHLEGILNNVVSAVETGKTTDQINKIIDNPDINYSITTSNNIATIKLAQKINFITPFSDYFFPEKYTIATKRAILYE